MKNNITIVLFLYLCVKCNIKYTEMLLKLYNNNTNERTVREVAKCLASGGVIVYPTDTVYALGCSLKSPKAIERLQSLKEGKSPKEMALACADLTSIATYAKVNDITFRTLRKNLPGAFTFILPASRKAPEKVLEGRSTIGIRVPDNPIALAIIRELGCPIVTTSIGTIDSCEIEYLTDPSLIEENYPTVDIVIDGGIGNNFLSTIVDCTTDGEPEIIRQGVENLK